MAKEKKFGWKAPSKRGCWAIKFRFTNEREGEAWFDTIFSVWEPKVGCIKLGREILGMTFGRPRPEIKASLLPEREIAVYPLFISPKGTKYFPGMIMKVVSAKLNKVNETIEIKYV